jgi:hypothetical protein
MIKVRVRHVRAGLAGVSGLMMLGNAAAGCAVEAEEESFEGVTSEATAAAGTGTFELTRADYSPEGPRYDLVETNSTDEFVRVGEKVTITAPSWFLFDLLEPNGGEVYTAPRMKKLKVTVHLSFVKNGQVTSTKDVKIASWQGTEFWNLSARFATFTIPKAADSIDYALTIVDGARTVTLGKADFLETPVFGGQAPLKHVIFDNNGGELRQRVVEGGNPIYGGEAVIAYTDWRADTVVDKMSIDRTIGKVTGFGRFGQYEMTIYGDVQYEVSYGYAFDDQSWQEQALPATSESRLLPRGGRTSYETKLPLPAGARKLSTYFHVKAYLVADYTRYGNITWKKYADGARVLVREKWDNKDGQPGQNYDFTLEKR